MRFTGSVCFCVSIALMIPGVCLAREKSKDKNRDKDQKSKSIVSARLTRDGKNSSDGSSAAAFSVREQASRESVIVGQRAPQPPGTEAALAAARRELEVAQRRLWAWDQVEYPLALQRMDNDIRLAEAELEIQRRRIWQFEGWWSNVRYSSAFSVTRDDARRCALAAELALNEMRDEYWAFVRARSDKRRLLEMDVEVASDRVRQLQPPIEWRVETRQ